MLANRIRTTSSTSGTGALTLAAVGVRDSASGDCLAPAEVLAELAGRMVPYFLINGAKWACGMVSSLAARPRQVSSGRR